MSDLLGSIAVGVSLTVITAFCFVVYAATAVVYGAPLLFVLWLTGAL